MSKDPLDRTLVHDPARGSDEIVDHTLNPGKAKKDDSGEGAIELRSKQRVEVIIPIEIQVVVEVPGADKVRGATENMSCSGMLARLNGPVQPDSRCQIHFLGGEDVTPSQVYARVVRIAKSRFGYSVAFHFDRTLQIDVAPRPEKKREF